MQEHLKKHKGRKVTANLIRNNIDKLTEEDDEDDDSTVLHSLPREELCIVKKHVEACNISVLDALREDRSLDVLALLGQTRLTQNPQT